MGAMSETLKIFLHLRSDFTKTSVVTSVTRNMIRASSDSNIIREGLKKSMKDGGGGLKTWEISFLTLPVVTFSNICNVVGFSFNIESCTTFAVII